MEDNANEDKFYQFFIWGRKRDLGGRGRGYVFLF